jgi:tRNA(Ile)-lysidine synthetase-like protein
MFTPGAFENVIRRHVPQGRWAVGVSGGADSVALLTLLHAIHGLSLRVVHLDHQTRGGASADDARFVQGLAEYRGIPCTVARRADVERGMTRLPVNLSARYRAARMELFRRVVSEHGLDGVVLAHHADDQAETVLQRLLRGSGPRGLAGMSQRKRVGGLTILRPMLRLRRAWLRRYLRHAGIQWCEDVSNESDCYLRNRLRKWLTDEPKLHKRVIEVARRCDRLREWTREQAPVLSDSFKTSALRGVPSVLARESVRRWLVSRGASPGDLDDGVLDRLVDMAEDAAVSPRQHFPGGLLIRRRAGLISAG